MPTDSIFFPVTIMQHVIITLLDFFNDMIILGGNLCKEI